MQYHTVTVEKRHYWELQRMTSDINSWCVAWKLQKCLPFPGDDEVLRLFIFFLCFAEKLNQKKKTNSSEESHGQTAAPIAGIWFPVPIQHCFLVSM